MNVIVGKTLQDVMQLDVSGPELVQIQIRQDGKVVWVNVDGLCLLRLCMISKLEIEDRRK